MIYGLTPLHAARKILSKLAKIEINALLQTGIEVLEQKSDGSYLIRLGRHTLQTKSETALVPGKEYWVDMEQTKEGSVRLSRLHPKPLLLKKEGFWIFGKELLSELSKESDPAEAVKEKFMQMMASSQSRESFQSLTQMLISLQHGVVTLPVEDRGRRMLLQMRKKKRENETLKEKSVEFYAAFNNLGPVEGAIVRYGEKKDLKLEVFYPKTARLLESLKEDLPGFSNISVSLSSQTIAPFWESDSLGLLDIRG
ncbi:hypothetical protein NNO_0785 [Hydrogenimonas sp.]|nr:hypothetical protein NNO_0785 [Hydrogenimonas sp.]